MARASTPVICNSDREAVLLGVREAAGVPAMIMSASFIGFGSMVHDAGWTLAQGIVNTLLTWALPGQITLVEMYNAGAPFLAITISVGLINARLFPMIVSLLPVVRRPGIPKWAYYLVAQIIAVTSWVGVMSRIPDLEPERRFPYLVGYGSLLFTISPIFAAIGFLAAGWVPRPVSIGLVFLNPLYFALVFLLDIRKPNKIIALALGAVMGPALFMVAADWSLLLTGIAGGTIAYVAGAKMEKRRG